MSPDNTTLPVTQADRNTYADYLRTFNGANSDAPFLATIMVGDHDAHHGPRLAAFARLATETRLATPATDKRDQLLAIIDPNRRRMLDPVAHGDVMHDVARIEALFAWDTPVDKSWSRTVARCTYTEFIGNPLKPHKVDLSCDVIASGAAVRWDSYWRRYRMPSCG